MSESECVVDLRKSMLIREIPKLNKFNVTGKNYIGEFFLKSLRVIVKRSVRKIRIIGRKSWKIVWKNLF